MDDSVYYLTKEEKAELKINLLVLVKRVCMNQNPRMNQCPEEVEILPSIVELLINRF